MEALIGVYQQGSIKRCAALDLSGNGIGDKGVTTLFRYFRKNSVNSIKHLVLDRAVVRGW